MRFIVILFLLILCQGCAPKASKEYVAAYSFMRDFAIKQQLENGLSVYCVGHSMPDGKVKDLTLDFVAQRKLNVDEARILYIKVTQQMLNQLNEDATLQFCLDHYPFKVDDLHVGLAFVKESGRDVDPPYIAYVSTTNGIIHYVCNDPSTNLFFKERFTEPYEEALRIVRSENGISHSGLNLSCRR